MTAAATHLEGGCLCGRVRFTLTQPPVRTLACQCRFCLRVTGSAFDAESIVPTAAAQFHGGPLQRDAHVCDTSRKTVTVEFCPACGTTVGLSFERGPEMRALSRGCLDDPDAVEISSHIWTRSAQTGVVLPARIDCFAEARATLAGEPVPATRHAAPVMARGGDTA